MAERYSVHLNISRVTTPDNTLKSGDRRVSSEPELKRKIETVGLTVRAPSLEKLREKIDAHLRLIDGDDFDTEPEKASHR